MRTVIEYKVCILDSMLLLKLSSIYCILVTGIKKNYKIQAWRYKHQQFSLLTAVQFCLLKSLRI